MQDTSNTFTLFPSEYPAVIIITLPENEEESQYAMEVRGNANVKAYQMLHQEKSEESQNLIVISVIGAVYQKKIPSSCDQCSNNNIVIYKEDFENDLKSWWKRFSRMLKELTKNYQIKDDSNYIEEMAGRLALFLGLTDEKFPSLFASENQRICKISLNAAQREILLFNSDPKIIRIW